MAAVARRPRQLAALIALLVRTPREYVTLSESCTGRSIERFFNQRRVGIVKNRLWRGVLLLPRDHADYLRGRRRHSLRNNLRRAATAGVRCEIISDSGRAGDEVSGLLRQQWGHLPAAQLDAQTNHFRELIARPEMTVMVAYDQRGGTLAVLGVTIDDSVSAIGFATATCHEARWALHDHLVRTLIGRRVRYLFAQDEGPFGALGYPRSVQDYQHLLGYELRHVIPIPAYRAARRRRRLALILVTASVGLVAPPAAQSAPGHGVARFVHSDKFATRRPASGPPVTAHEPSPIISIASGRADPDWDGCTSAGARRLSGPRDVWEDCLD